MDGETAIAGGCLFGWLAIMGLGAIGWIMNIVKIFSALGDPITGLFVGRVIGAFIFPIGCVAGWM